MHTKIEEDVKEIQLQKMLKKATSTCYPMSIAIVEKFAGLHPGSRNKEAQIDDIDKGRTRFAGSASVHPENGSRLLAKTCTKETERPLP